MKNKKTGIILGIVSAIIGLFLTIFGVVETINVASGKRTPIKENGEAAGAGLYIILLCVGAVILVGSVVILVKTIKNNKK